MSPVVLAALCALAPEATRLSAAAPDPAALLLLTPTGEPGRVSRSEALRAIEEALDAETSLRAVAVAPEVNEDCRGRLACIIEGLDSATQEARWLLVLTQITLEGEPDRVTPVLVHTGPLGERATEDEVDAVSHRGAARRVDTPEEMRDALRAALRGPFRDVLQRAGKIRSTGEIRLAATAAGALVHLDDRPLGTTGEGPMVIERVSPGLHRLRLTLPGRPPWSREVTLGADERLALEPAIEAAVGADSGLRVGFALGGAATAVAGGVLLAVAASAADGNVKTACFNTQAGCEAGTGFVGFEYDPTAERPRGVDPAGVGPGPLGAALLTTGLGLGIGALLEDDEVPWWSLGLGLAAGGAVLGAAIALDAGQLP